MKFTEIDYYCGFILLLAVMLLNRNTDYTTVNVLRFIILTCIINLVIHNIPQAVGAAIAIVFFLSFCEKFTASIESFDLEQLTEEDKKQLRAELDADEDAKVDEDTPASKYTPAQAQRETFRLVNTVKKLEETMKSVAPVVQEGQKIMKAMESLKLN